MNSVPAYIIIPNLRVPSNVDRVQTPREDQQIPAERLRWLPEGPARRGNPSPPVPPKRSVNLDAAKAPVLPKRKVSTPDDSLSSISVETATLLESSRLVQVQKPLTRVSSRPSMDSLVRLGHGRQP